jgi:hypothetical protein
MAHFITGLIAKLKLLEAFAAQKSLHKPSALSQGFAFLALRDADIDSFIAPPHTGHAEGFIYLSEQPVAEITSASIRGQLSNQMTMQNAWLKLPSKTPQKILF